MRKLILAVAAVALPLGVEAQTTMLTPTLGGSSQWQVSCSVAGMVSESQPTGSCNGAFQNAATVSPNAGGWTSTPTPGGASYISVLTNASLWSGSPNENQHYQYTFRTWVTLASATPSMSLDIGEFWFDNYFVGYSINGSALTTAGINPPPAPPNGSNWTTPFTINTISSDFTAGSNYIDFVITGNGRTDGMLLSGSVSAIETTVPEPSTYALMAAGLAAMGVVARRRRQA